jgi:hypothetical protein
VRDGDRDHARHDPDRPDPDAAALHGIVGESLFAGVGLALFAISCVLVACGLSGVALFTWLAS